ncbi:MAG: hypothetical protein LAO20_17090 [Acidobacteriia bacterium]|nr:hypothetical protein [Terriglobia bacterium]
MIATSHRAATLQDLQTLAGFHDPAGNAVSFYFKPGQGEAAERDAMIAQLRARSIISDSFGQEKPHSGLLRDLDAVMKISEETEAGAPMKVVFACHDQGVWEEFDLPSGQRIVRIEAGKQFDLAPLQRLLQQGAPGGPVH